MVLVDKANDINKEVVLAQVSQYGARQTDVVTVLATGTFSGTPKLQMSLDGENYVPLLNDNGDQVSLTVDVPVFLAPANVWVKVDLTGVSSNDLKVDIA